MLTLASPAGADPRPSATDIAKARQQAQDRAHELGQAEAELADARARQRDLTANAERLVEAYNGELVRLAAARAAYQQAELRLRRANDQFEQVRSAVAAEAAERYGGIGMTSPTAAMIAGFGDVGGFLRRATLVTHLTGEQAATLGWLRDSRQVYEIMRSQAAQAYAEQVRTAERVRLAKDAAKEAVDRQVEQTRRIEQEKTEISRRLDAARSRVDRLKRAREETRRRSASRRQSTAVPSWAARLGSGRGGLAAQWALRQLGKPYVWAAAGPSGFDCSGLTMRAWRQAGITLDHWTGTQWTAGRHVPLNALRTGDLLFYGRSSRDPSSIHHVGIYIGRGLMVHAPQTGDVVRISPIWRRDLIGATRPG